MDIEELKQKALQLMVDKGWDVLLAEAYLNTQHFVAWSRRDDFEELYNIGIQNITGKMRDIDFLNLKNKETEFLVGEISGINFEIGGLREYWSTPDGDCFTWQYISLWVDGKRVIAASYSVRRDDALQARDLELLSVEELHKSELIDALLTALHDGKVELEKKRGEKKKKEAQKHYAGKFNL